MDHHLRQPVALIGSHMTEVVVVVDDEERIFRDTPKLESHKIQGKWGTLFLAYKTLGVVFGGLVTSPLYVYPSTKLKSPTEEDYLGVYSIIFWTLTLIGVVKYATIAVKADDQGEGGTFALYSLLCKNMNIDILSTKSQPSNSSSAQGLCRFFEQSLVARRVLLFIAILGMCMLIGDGVVTPAISVLSAMEGIKAPFPSFTQLMVKLVSAVILVTLFLLQKYGTSRVSFIFSPIMGVWTLTTPMVGIHRIIEHYPGIFKAISPYYIFTFFSRNGNEGWLLLSGTILCITGAEAMLADLGPFNSTSIQIAFLCTIYPSLVLTYAGQTAYLIKNPNDHADGFYKFIPSAVYWPMFVVSTLAAIVASQSLISAAFSIIKQSVALDYFPRVKIAHTSTRQEREVYAPEVNYMLMVICVALILIFGDGAAIGNAYGVVVNMVMLITTVFLTLVMIIIWKTPSILVAAFFVVFFAMEGVYLSSVLTKIPQGGWIPFAISLVLAFIMFGWILGRKRKMQYELANKIDLDSLRKLLSESDIQRVPGICFFYSNIQDGLTPVLGHYMRNTRSLPRLTIFTTLRYLPTPKVTQDDKILVRKLGPQGVYECLVQYGYEDSLTLNGNDFSQHVTEAMVHHITSNSSYHEDIAEVEEAKRSGVIHIRGKTKFHINNDCGWFDRSMLAFYQFLHNNCRSGFPALGIPLKQCIEVGMLYEA